MTETALLNHLWQSTVFAAAAAGVALALRGYQARVRFWVWMAASVKFLVPFSALAALGRLISWSPAARPAPAALAAVGAPFAATWSTITFFLPTAATPTQGSLLPWLLLGSAAGSVALLLRWSVRWLRLARIARNTCAEERNGLRILTTTAAVEPGVFGILRPVLLLPQGIEARLSPAQLAAVLEHERCHMQRRDNLWSGLHMLVEALFWFHPLVWWTGAKLIAERERACDEAVLRSGSDREAYAGGMLAVCRFYTESPLACAAGITGGGLKQRVGEIMQGHWGRNLGFGKKLLLGGLGTAALAGPLAAGILFSQTPAAPVQFDAASITVAKPPSGNRVTMRVGLRTLPTQLSAENMSLKDLIVTAYNLKSYQVTGPDWISAERFDISAEVTKPLPRDEMNRLLAPFLVQQFKLVTHKESKVMPIYTLAVASGGSKLKPADPKAAGALGDKPGIFMMRMGPKGAELKGTSDMAGIADMVSRQLGRPVVDKTALSGVFDYTLNFAPDFHEMGGGMIMAASRLNGGPPPQGAEGVGKESGDTAAPAPTLFMALQEQLGLKLDAGKGPVEILVVDSANKVPVGN